MKIAAVSVYKTLDRGDGEFSLSPGTPVEDAKALFTRLKKDGYYVVVVDSFANTIVSVQILMDWLRSNDLPFDDIYQGFGALRADLYVNDLARSVKDVLSSTD